MELSQIGFSDWFRQQLGEIDAGDAAPARVTAVNRDNYEILGLPGEMLAQPSGDFLFRAWTSMDLPVVGDWVLVSYHNDDTFAVIHQLLPRRSVLRRKAAGKKIDYQPIAANIDTACIVQSCDFNFNLRRLERYLVMVRDGGIAPLVLLSKRDLVSDAALSEHLDAIAAAGIDSEVMAYSSRDEAGLSRVRQALLPGQTYCLLGSSGVGKTTLLNSLIGGAAFETGPVREFDGKGRHTTSRRQLTRLAHGAMIVDTPGMRELGSIGVDDGIGSTFGDIERLAAGCRFSDCTHTCEAGCAVLRALADSELDEGRYQSYIKLSRESDFHQMSYHEKRVKDKEFGRFVRSVLKQHKKYR